jgi:hypothetical protein
MLLEWHVDKKVACVQVLLVTGATGVMMASYVVPVVNHLLLYFGKYGCNPLSWLLCCIPLYAHLVW